MLCCSPIAPAVAFLGYRGTSPMCDDPPFSMVEFGLGLKSVGMELYGNGTEGLRGTRKL